MQRFNVSGCQKNILETNGYRMENIFGDVNVGAQIRNFSFPPIFGLEMQKLKFYQEFMVVIDVYNVYIAICWQSYYSTTADVQNMQM